MLFVLFNGAVMGKTLFGHLCTKEYLDDEPEPLQALRCMLLSEDQLISRHVGFASVTDGMVTLGVMSTLDGWVRNMLLFRIDAGARSSESIDEATRGLRQFHNSSLSADERQRGLFLSRAALPGCVYSWELQALQAEGLVRCDDGKVEIACEGKLRVYAVLRHWCMRPSATSVSY